jgi:UDP-glucuronate 4-epimerase
MFGDGSMRRDFTHVDDIARGILAAFDRAPAGYRPYNLGSAAPIDLAGLVRAIGETAGRDVRVEARPVPRGDVEATFADIERARVELEWTPRIALRDGLATVKGWVVAHP